MDEMSSLVCMFSCLGLAGIKNLFTLVCQVHVLLSLYLAGSRRPGLLRGFVNSEGGMNANSKILRVFNSRKIPVQDITRTKRWTGGSHFVLLFNPHGIGQDPCCLF